MSIALFAKLVHVLFGMGFVAGLAGRALAMHNARSASDVRTLAALSDLGGSFDRLLVIPCSQLVLLAGLVTAWLQGWPILGFVVGGSTNWVFVSLVLYLGVTALVPTVFLPSGRAFDAALRGALDEGRITEPLRRALDDRRVAFAHRAEAIGVAVIVVLMVLKPF